MSAPRQPVDRRDGAAPVQLAAVAAAWLMLAALAALRIWWLSDSVAAVPAIDAKEYLSTALAALDAAPPSEPYFHSPLYTWFLAAGFSLFGVDLTLVRLVQAALGAATCLIAYALGKRFFDPATGVVAAWMAALYGPIVFYLGELLNTALLLLLHPLLVLVLVRAWDQPAPGRIALAGAVAGLAAANRPDVLPLVAVFLVASLLARREARSEKARIAAWAAFVALAAAPLLAAGVHNWRATGRFLLLPINSSLNLYIGNNPSCERTIGVRPGAAWRDLVEVPRSEVRGDPAADPGLGRTYLRRVAEFLRDDPQGALGCLGFKLRTLFNGYELPETFDLYSRRDGDPILSVLVGRIGPLFLPFGLVMPWAVVGLVVAMRRGRDAAPLLVAGLALALPLVVWWNGSRYRMAIVPLCIVCAAGGLSWLVRRLRAGALGAAALGFAAVAATAVLLNWPYAHFSREYDFRAETLACAGIARLEQGRLAEAEELLRQSLARVPEYLEARTNLAMVLVRRGESRAAAAELERAIAVRPGDAALHGRLGAVRLAAGQRDRATVALEEAVRLDPADADAWFNLGLIALQQGHDAEAETHFARAVTADPGHVSANVNLSALLAQRGDFAAAMATLERVRARHPGDRQIAAAIGEVRRLQAAGPGGR